MKQLLIFIGLFTLTISTYSQTDEFAIYYPENPLYKRLRVKSELDTIASPAFHHYKKEYDTLGRQISWFYVEDSLITRFRYQKNGDTLIKYHYYTKNRIDQEIYQYELFYYNKQGYVLTYQSCSRSYGSDINTSVCNMVKFFYDAKNRLTSKLIYSNGKYNQPFSTNLKLVERLLELTDVYSYQYNETNKLILKKQMIGKPEYRSTDSFYYDKTNKLVRIVRRQKQGYLNEFAVGNLCGTKTIEYEKNKKTETTWATYSDSEINKIKSIDIDINEYVYYSNGLKRMRYHKLGNSPKSILNYSEYEFY